jgi:hypothetical protein
MLTERIAQTLARLSIGQYTWDLIAMAGVLLTAVGIACIYPPAAVIFLGLLLTLLGLWGARAWSSRAR